MEKTESTFLYILYSESLDKYYTGISHDPIQGLQYHNSSANDWTRRGRPWTLVFKKQFNSRQLAQNWETWIKQRGNRTIIDRMVSGNFNWESSKS